MEMTFISQMLGHKLYHQNSDLQIVWLKSAIRLLTLLLQITCNTLLTDLIHFSPINPLSTATPTSIITHYKDLQDYVECFLENF